MPPSGRIWKNGYGFPLTPPAAGKCSYSFEPGNPENIPLTAVVVNVEVTVMVKNTIFPICLYLIVPDAVELLINGVVLESSVNLLFKFATFPFNEAKELKKIDNLI